MLLKYRFTYRLLFKIGEFDIEAFSLPRAIEKFYANFPRAKILYIREVTE